MNMTMLATYVHRIDPFVFEFSPGIGIRWYGLAYVAGFLAAFLLVRMMAKRRLTPLEVDRVPDVVLAVAVGVIVGGRLGYCLFYRPDLLTDFSNAFPYWGVLAMNRGGMASHGGIIGVIIAGWWFARRSGQRPTHIMDLIALTAPIGIFFGRVANFINGELLGRAAPETLPWAVKFPQEVVNWPARNPEALASPEFGRVLSMVQELYGRSAESTHMMLQRVALAARENDAVATALEPLLTPRHPSQLYAALLEGLVVFVVLAWLWRLPRKPGFIAGAAMVLYPIVRIISEAFRMPDLHLGFRQFDRQTP
ncbi:MAG: prolipoprotein diacylglyceryl transferase, partial [Phycisphaeraceae bacterium]